MFRKVCRTTTTTVVQYLYIKRKTSLIYAGQLRQKIVYFSELVILECSSGTWSCAYTCVNWSYPYALLSRFTPKGRKIGRTVSGFEIFYFELLDPETLSAARSILRHLQFLYSSAKKLRTSRAVVRIFRFFFFRAAGSWNFNKQHAQHILFQAAGSWNFDKYHAEHILMKTWIRRPF